MSTTRTKRKVTNKALIHKYEALKKLENGEARKDIAAFYNIPRNTLSTWIKNKDKIIQAFQSGFNHQQQKLRTSNHGNLDKALYNWFIKAREESVPISGPLLREQAVKCAEELNIENFNASNGWVDRWKHRHAINIVKAVSGEAKPSTTTKTTASFSEVKSCTTAASLKETTLPAILSSYELRDIYNAHEFGLLYNALPEKCLQSEISNGGKHSKMRLTALAAANAEGDKLPMFVIGKFAKPACFDGVLNLPCRYRGQKKSCMDSTLFEEWIAELDRQFERQGREIALIVDNSPAHPKIFNLRAIALVFLPANSTPKTLPMNQGVIGSTKAYYRAACVRKYLDAVEQHKRPPAFSILDAMSILTEAWSKVSKETVKDCFTRAGIGRQAQLNALNKDDNPFEILSEALSAYQERHPELGLAEVSAEDIVSIDDEVLTSDVDSSDEETLLEEESSIDEDEECPKRPTNIEVRQALDTLSCYSLFAQERGDEIRCQTNQLSFVVQNSIRKVTSTTPHWKVLSHCQN